MHYINLFLHPFSLVCVGFCLGVYISEKFFHSLFSDKVLKPSSVLLWVALLNLVIWIATELGMKGMM